MPNSGTSAALRQAEFLLQRQFAGGLPRQARRGIRARQKRVMRRIPFIVIHAVENAQELFLPPAQKPVQAAAEFLRGDFARIARADRRDDVGENDAGLQAIQMAVKFRAFHGEKIPAADWSAQRRPAGKFPDTPDYEWSGRSAADSPTLPRAAVAASTPAPARFASRERAPRPAATADNAPDARRIWKGK